MARILLPGATRYLDSTRGITSSRRYCSNNVVFLACNSRGDPNGTACPNGITTIMGTAFFSAIRLSRMKFAPPTVVQPAAVSFEP